MSTDIQARYTALRSKYADRDARMAIVHLARKNKLKQILPAAFSSKSPFGDGSVIASRIEIAAQDMAEKISPLPTFKCEQANMTTEKEQNKASLRTKIVNSYVIGSDLQRQMASAGNWFPTYGFVAARVEPNWDRKAPEIRFLDSRGIYPLYDRMSRLIAVYWRQYITEADLCAKYPEHRIAIMGPWAAASNTPPSADKMVEIIFYHDKDMDAVFTTGKAGVVLSSTPNRMGKVLWRVANRPDLDPEDPRGQFDDAVYPHVFRHALAMMRYEATQKSVRSPLAVPTDVGNVPLGPDAIIPTNNPQGVRRIPLEVPAGLFQQDQIMEAEVAKAARHPETRMGESPSSIITGRGVQELTAGFDSQAAAYQGALAPMFADLLSLCLEMDEAFWPDETKVIRGKAEGARFEITYKPSKDIAGDHTVEVQYGLSTGMDPNRALIFGLQGMSAKLFSKDTVMRQVSSVDSQEEQRKIAIEQAEDLLWTVMQQSAMSMPAMAAQGADITETARTWAEVVKGIREGKPMEDLMLTSFGVLSEKEQAKADRKAAREQAAAPEGAPVDPAAGAPALAGDNPLAGVPGQSPQGRPDMMQLLAGLRGDGSANMQANVNQSMVI